MRHEILRGPFDLPDVEPAEPMAAPTPEQWVRWFRTQTTERQVEIAIAVDHSNAMAAVCFQTDHAGRIAALDNALLRLRNGIKEAEEALATSRYIEAPEDAEPEDLLRQGIVALREQIAQVRHMLASL